MNAWEHRGVATRNSTIEGLERRRLLTGVEGGLLDVPALSSRPGSPHTMFLDFDGDALDYGADEMQFWIDRDYPGFAPAFTLDSDPATLTEVERQAIVDIWDSVAEKFSPFDINVTTVAPPTLADGVAGRVLVGDTSLSWADPSDFDRSLKGRAPTGGFVSALSNTAFSFTENWSASLVVLESARTTAHEAGHLLGLRHQSEFVGNYDQTSDNGNSGIIQPLLGDSHFTERAVWWDGIASRGEDNVYGPQDDVDILVTGQGSYANNMPAWNGIGWAADDHGQSIGSASSLVVNGDTKLGVIAAANATGLTDQDWFAFDWVGGFVAVQVDPALATVDPMLDASLRLLDHQNNEIAVSASSNLSETIFLDLQAGTYFASVESVRVVSQGEYGDAYNGLGQYGIRVSGTPETVPPTLTQSVFTTTDAVEWRLVFDEAVVLADAAAFSLTHVASSTVLSPDSLQVTINADEVTVRYVDGNGAATNLPLNGDYRLSAAGAISDAAGNVAGADAAVVIFFLNGDANGDRRVDLSDFLVLRSNFNTDGLFAEGDFNFDGLVNLSDFLILRSNFNVSFQASGDSDDESTLF